MNTQYLLILLSMIFCHIFDDYYLQGWLSQAKQKKYWEENFNNKLYKYDYIVALFMHSFSWSFMIILPCIIYGLFNNNLDIIYTIFGNAFCHMIVDDAKANKGKINLLIDQSIHIAQILLTFIIFCVIFN